MGFSRATHNVLYANNSRGKGEGLCPRYGARHVEPFDLRGYDALHRA